MLHPFETELSKLKEIDFDLEENITDDQLEQVSGGGFATTLAIGEEGGGGGVTTLAIGEEGGGGGVTTLALGEEGGGRRRRRRR